MVSRALSRVGFSVAILLAAAGAVAAQTSTQTGAAGSEVVAQAGDVSSPDAILKAVYEVISGSAGVPRDWNRFRSLFAEGARLIPTGQRPDGTRSMQSWTVEEYILRAGANLERTGFHEREIGRTEQRFGQVMHAWSVYESRRNQDDPEPFQRGINSIQMRHDGSRWWIVTIFWDSERPDNPIPSEYLRRNPPDDEAKRS